MGIKTRDLVVNPPTIPAVLASDIWSATPANVLAKWWALSANLSTAAGCNHWVSAGDASEFGDLDLVKIDIRKQSLVAASCSYCRTL